MPSLKALHDRREILRLIAASMALSSCGKPEEEILAAVDVPPDIVSGRPDFYTTASVVDGHAAGILVEHRMGRPFKVEGNPDHPASLGATDAIAQAQIMGLYDPDRSRSLLFRHRPATTQNLQFALRDAAKDMRILTGTTTSPTLIAQIEASGLTWHRWDAVSRDNVRAGALQAFGRPVDTVPMIQNADVILAIDSDLLSGAPGHVRFARDFAARRNPLRTAQMSRIYAIEPTPSAIGIAADHRFVAGPAEISLVLASLRATLLEGLTLPQAAPPWLAPIVADLIAHRGRSLIHIGFAQPAWAHALVHALNERLDAPLRHLAPMDGTPETLDRLVEDIARGAVPALIILGANPVFTAPGFADALKSVPVSFAVTPEYDETAQAATWHIPQAHLLEAWSDARAFDGTATILQPQTRPLFGGFNPHQILGWVKGEAVDPLALIRKIWRDHDWQDSLARGVVQGTAGAEIRPRARPPSAVPESAAVMTLLFRPDPHLWDGSFANNPWLQELPRVMTKVVWDNPLLIPPSLAADIGLKNGDIVELRVNGRRLETPVWIQPGQARDCLVAQFGFGRTCIGEIGAGHGVDFYPLRVVADLHAAATSVELIRTGRRAILAATERHDPMEPAAQEALDGIIRRGTLDSFPVKAEAPTETLYDSSHLSKDVAWGMSIDLNACIGCNACIAACTAENNVPVVGKAEVARGRAMHWLRIDRYYAGSAENPEAFFQPMLCMHCEHAPCEVVCPVGATVHDAEGLNVMVYNRCIGTRFCSNNCPYKVRHFNFFDYAHQETRPAAARNPDVSVRARGVMEKCTFCIQRIAASRIEADTNGTRPEIQTACQAACPTQAITFGNGADPASEVAQRKAGPLSYALLAELNTRPRVTYEAVVRNPNPEIET